MAKKVLLMGKAQAGKTSMRSIIFANYLARDTMRLTSTLDVENHHVRFLGDLVLNLWDCGGQDAFYESYLWRDRQNIFQFVELLIYVFDVESDCPEKDFEHFAGVLMAIEENSPDARIFVLVHKMDLVIKNEQEIILNDRKRLIKDCCSSCGVHNFQSFGTSIWDETLYKAWCCIVTNLIPNLGVLENHLDHFCTLCDADEVVLFERATFLVISHSRGYCESEETSVEPEDKEIVTCTPSKNNINTIQPKEQPPEVNEYKRSDEIVLHMDGLSLVSSTGPTTAVVNAATIVKDNNKIISQLQQQLPHPKSSVYSEPTIGITPSRMTLTPPSKQPGNKQHKRLVRHKHTQRRNTVYYDAHRFEKISNIVKQLRLKL